MDKLPPNLQMGMDAYLHFYQNPQIPFDGLSHEYQMKWVNLARFIIDQYKRIRNIDDVRIPDQVGAHMIRVSENAKWETPPPSGTPPSSLKSWLNRNVPKQGGKSGRYAWNKLPDDRRVVARRVAHRLHTAQK